MVKVNANGTLCNIGQCPVAPFTDWKTGQVDIMAISKAGTFLRRAALQNYFVNIRPSTATQTRMEEDEEGEGEEAKETDQSGSKAAERNKLSFTPAYRFFLASVHLKLTCASPEDAVIQAVDLGEADVTVTSAGSSSYSLASMLYFSDIEVEGENMRGRLPMGSGQVTYVRIDPDTRRPTPLDDVYRQGVLSYVDEERNKREGVGKMERLQPPASIKALNGGAATPELAKEVVLITNKTYVRHSDTDFNGHTNQLAYINFAVDCTRLYLESSAVLNTKETQDYPHPAQGTDIAELRVDYLNEVREIGTEITITLMKAKEEDGDVAKRLWFTQSFLKSGESKPTIACMGFVILQ